MYKIHKLSLVFPDMSAEEYQTLKYDIQNNGYDKRYPVILYENQILDGRHRFKACQELKIKPIFEEYNGNDPLGLVVRSNKRRNLTVGQWAAINLELSALVRGQGSGRTSEKIATMTESSRPAIEKMKRVVDFSKELAEEVKSGKTTLEHAHNEVKAKRHTEQREEAVKDIKFDDALILGSSIKALEQLKNGSVKCLLTDPPYGIDYVSNRRGYDNETTTPIVADNQDKAINLLDKTLSIIKPKMAIDSSIYIFTSWKVYAETEKVIKEYFDVKNLIVWDKMNHGSGDLDAIWSERHELIIYATKGKPKRIGKRLDNIIDCPRVKSLEHPTEKPIQLLEDIINASTIKGELVVDPFVGSGNTLVAAKKLGRKYFGSEIDEKWYEVAQGRLSKC